MNIDLHTHTYMSDGLLSPKELLLMAKAKGVNTIAISDHDTYYHMKEAKVLAKKLGIELINAIELSCYNFSKMKKVHIVGLFLNDDAPNCERLGNGVLEGRNRFHKKMINDINALGYNITYDEVKSFSKSNTIFKMHLYMAIKSKYPEVDVNFYKKHFLKDDTSDVDLEMNYISVEEGIKAILQDGGIPILAHPPLYNSMPELEEYVSYGLKGIEVSHPCMTLDDQVEVTEAARKYQLYLSGGSDFHFESNVVTLGEYGVTQREFETLKRHKLYSNK